MKQGYIDSPPAIKNRTLFVGSSDYRLYAFRLEERYVEQQTTRHEIIWTTIAVDIAFFSVVGFTIYILVNSFFRQKARYIGLKPVAWIKSHLDACFVIILIVASGILYLNLSTGVLWVFDEQTYSQWAYHMVKTGDYLTPWAFGDTTIWIGKPPLNIWLISIAYQFLGVSNFSTRVISAVFGSMSLITTYYIGKSLYNKTTGFLSAITLAAFTTFYTFSTHAMTDIPFVFFTTASFYFYLQSEKNQIQNKYLLLSGLFFGLALLTKQIAALIIPIVIFSYIVLTKKSIRLIFTERILIFLATGLLLFIPWFIYMYVIFTDQFWHWFIVYCGFTRALNPIEGHTGGYLFYLDYLSKNETYLALFLPFAIVLCLYKAAIKNKIENSFILLWITIVLVVFTFAQTKIAYYILPAFPAFALSIGALLHEIMGAIRNMVKQKKNAFQKLSHHEFS
jgi:4-amino-4-deoxy-L-arabinose transferase-like glycosyltransferase